MSIPAKTFGPRDTIYSQTGVANNTGKATIQWHMIAEKVQGQPPHSTIGLFEKSFEIDGHDGPAIYNVSAPTAGWPLGTYELEAGLLVDGRVKELEIAEFTIVASLDDAGNSASASPAVTKAAIQKYIDGELNSFSGLAGEVTTKGPNPTYYESALTLPGARACSIYVFEKDDHYFGTCNIDADTEASARTLYAAWTQNVLDAEPGWAAAAVNPLPKGDLVATVLRDPENVRAAYLYVSKLENGKYSVTITFATMAALRS
jgi:hypothetical protein